jgi:hypothetical protein
VTGIPFGKRLFLLTAAAIVPLALMAGMSLYALQRQQVTVRILANDQERARDAILEAFALNEDQLAPGTVPADRQPEAIARCFFNLLETGADAVDRALPAIRRACAELS